MASPVCLVWSGLASGVVGGFLWVRAHAGGPRVLATVASPRRPTRVDLETDTAAGLASGLDLEDHSKMRPLHPEDSAVFFRPPERGWLAGGGRSSGLLGEGFRLPPCWSWFQLQQEAADVSRGDHTSEVPGAALEGPAFCSRCLSCKRMLFAGS